MKQLTFNDVCNQLKKNKDFSEKLDDLSALSGAAILLLGVKSASGDISVFLDALAVKDQLINIGKCILGKIVSEKTNECDKRYKHMQWAYSIIYYTAFFDVLDEKMPEQMRVAISLSVKEKKDIFRNSGSEKNERENALTSAEIFFPNMVYGYADIEIRLKDLYHSMSVGLMKFVHMLSFEETGSELMIAEFNDIVKNMPQLAIERFRAQYFYLASKYNEFYIYMQIEKEKEETIHIEKLYRNLISVSRNVNQKIDVGLEHLETILLDLPEKIHESKVNGIVENLIDKYKRDIEGAIIDSGNNDEKLKYPSIDKAFIPQSYKILEYSGKEKLEKKQTWDNQLKYNNMDSFWAKYYASPYSLESLLLILGEPGGGKSLLTKVICARMSDRNNITVRIPLREISVEKDIEDIVREQIQRDGDASEQLPTYKWFAQHFKNNPITLVFDGYDEVLQATGGVYRNFLNKIKKFQTECAERNRPVRIVVTSRETLIDKADIPVGTITLKLLEFNKNQRDTWINIWNQYNNEVFRKENITPFVLPENNKSIDELSTQPLLLLMLAIYDANFEEGKNSLGQEENLNRTRLYSELLQRFIRRELRKGPRGKEISYEESSEEDKEEMVNLEMEKLGIAALGMFIRGKLSLKVSEMERDLVYMESPTLMYDSVGKMLSSAEKFFLSFFFIHDSQTGNTETDDREVAFEFLHKTFYEFLVADLVLKYLVQTIDELNELKNLKRSDRYRKALNDPDSFNKQYYTVLMNYYLCAEPEIIEMMVEWKECIIDNYFQGARPEYDDVIKELFDRQVEMLHNNIFIPQIWNEKLNDNVTEKSYMQYCAAYFMNLLILQIVTKADSERTINMNDWKYMSQFWKMNIQEDILLKFTSLFVIRKKEGNVCVAKRQVPKKVEEKGLLEKRKTIFNFLQDNVSCNLYNLHDMEVRHNEKQSNRKNLLNIGINIEMEVLLGEVKEFILGNNRRFFIRKNIENVTNILTKSWVDESVIFDWIVCINTCLDRRDNEHRIHNGLMEKLAYVILDKYPENAQVISVMIQCCRKMEGIDIIVGSHNLFSMFEKAVYYNPQLMLEYINLLEHTISFKQMKTIADRLREMLYETSSQSLEVIVSILKKLYSLGIDPEMNDILHNIVINAKEYYNSSPKVMIDILRLCILQGKEDDVRFLLRTELENYETLFFEHPALAVEFLEVIYTTKGAQRYVERILNYNINEFESIIEHYPRIALKIVKVIPIMERPELLKAYYRRYNYLFNIAPKESIEFLRLTRKEVDEESLDRELQFALNRFTFLVVKSPEAALDLLLLCEDIELDRCTYIQTYFNYVLYHNILVDSIKLKELFLSLKDYELDEIAEYFSGKYYYIISDFPNLAKIIAQYYSDSYYRELFVKVLSEYEHNYIADKEYISCLRQLWNYNSAI